MTLPYADCRRILARHSRSFALAGRLLAPARRDRLAGVYAWCREADDAIDAAYRTKYQRYGGRYVDPMIAPGARETTLKLVPTR